MNPYIIEPYNAWNKAPRKKHWMEVVEEEQLMARIIAEGQPSSQQTQETSIIAGNSGGVVGGGGIPPYNFFVSPEPIILDNILYLFGTTSEEVPAPSGNYDYSGNSWTKVYAHNCPDITVLNVSSNQLSIVELIGLSTLDELNCNNNILTSLSLNGLTSLYSVSCNNNQLTSLTLTGCSQLYSLDCNNNQLTSLNISDCVSLNALNCSLNNINNIDDILIALDVAGTSAGVFDSSGGTNASPSGGGITAKANLQGKSWLVITN